MPPDKEGILKLLIEAQYLKMIESIYSIKQESLNDQEFIDKTLNGKVMA